MPANIPVTDRIGFFYSMDFLLFEFELRACVFVAPFVNLRNFYGVIGGIGT